MRISIQWRELTEGFGFPRPKNENLRVAEPQLSVWSLSRERRLRIRPGVDEETLRAVLLVLLEGIDLSQRKRRKVANYKRVRKLVNQWVDLAVEQERAERVQEKYRDGD